MRQDDTYEFIGVWDEQYKRVGFESDFEGRPISRLIRCKECKHRFEGEKFHNCCEVLMEMSHWLAEIPVKDDWHCGSGERKEE